MHDYYAMWKDWQAVQHLGIESPAELEALFAEYVRRVSPDELLRKLA